MSIKGYRFGANLAEFNLSLLLIAIAVSLIAIASKPLLEKIKRREALMIVAGAAADVVEHAAYHGHLDNYRFQHDTHSFIISGEGGLFNAYYLHETSPSMRFQFSQKHINGISRRLVITCTADVPYMLPQICMAPL